MSPILVRASFRYLLHHPWQLLLNILGIGLGVAVVVGVDLANESAYRSFDLSTDYISGEATHSVVGGPSGVPEEQFARLRIAFGVRRSAPVVEGQIVFQGLPGRSFTLMGVDPFSEALVERRGASPGSANGSLLKLLTEPNAVLLPVSLAKRLGASAGDRLWATAGIHERDVLVAAVAEYRGLDGVIFADIASAQELLGMPGRLSRIDLHLEDGVVSNEQIENISAALPEGLQLEDSRTRNEAVADLSRSFRLNLGAMSLLALLVGMLLIYNTVTFSVVQRRTLLGRLRAVGVQRHEILTMVLLEAGIFGVAGLLVGLALGLVLGNLLLDLVSRTISEFYHPVPARQFWPAQSSLLKGAALGLATTLLAAWPSAREAAATPPVQALQRSSLEAGTQSLVRKLAWTGAASLLLGTALLALPVRSVGIGFLGLFVIVLGCASLSSMALCPASWVARRLAGVIPGPLAAIAARNLDRHLSRTALAVAALMLAVSATIGVGAMVSTFRAAVDTWLGQLLNADLYVAPSNVGSDDPSIRILPETLERLRSVDGVAELSLYRSSSMMFRGRMTTVIGVELTPRSKEGYRLIAGDPSLVWSELATSPAILVSEPFAYHHRVKRGDRLILETAGGARSVRVAGVFFDYGSEHGRMVMNRDHYSRLWGDSAVGSAALFLTSDADPEKVADRIVLSAGEIQPLILLPGSDIRTRSLAVFDQTFAITSVLRTLVLVVAFIGVLSALLAMLLERSGEFALLRALGLTKRELFSLLCMESGLLGLIAGILAVPTGIVLSWILVFVINRRAFGWTMPFDIDWQVLSEGVLLAVIAAVIAGLYPAFRCSGPSPASALRQG